MLIGLTGGIATGKSTVSRMLLALGETVIDSDQIARQVVEPGELAYLKIVQHFGEHILQEDRTINRKALGAIVFTHPEERKVLEEITHPIILDEMQRQAKAALLSGIPRVFFDVPLLIEINMHKQVDKVVVVYTDEETQLQRLMERDRLSKEEALKRMKAQMPIDEKVKYADYIIENDGTIAELEMKVKRLIDILKMGE